MQEKFSIGKAGAHEHRYRRYFQFLIRIHILQR